MTSKAETLKAQLLDKAVATARKRLGRDKGATVAAFARHFYAGVAAEDILETPAANLFGAAHRIVSFAGTRQAGVPLVRAYNPNLQAHGWQSTHTIIEIVNDDMPFLVDSVVAALNRMELTVHLLIHPIFKVRRGANGKLTSIAAKGAKGTSAESIVHVQVDQQSDAAALARIESELQRVLRDVGWAVSDWRKMLGQVDALIEELDNAPPKLDKTEIEDGREFLAWARDNNFTFLGCRDYALRSKGGKTYLDIVAKSSYGVLRQVTPASAARHKNPLSTTLARFAKNKHLLIITKASTRSTVHRHVYMDYIGVRRFDKAGNVIGERRFLGLLTSAAYNRNPRDIPLLGRKVQRIIDKSGFAPNSHNGKALMNVLETYPRDELFQISEPDLSEIAKGICHLEERQRIRLFVRKDSYARFHSCLVYVPREKYSGALRLRFEKILLDAFHGESIEFNTHLGEAAMARVHFIVHSSAERPGDLDVPDIEARLVEASRDWTDDLKDALIDDHGEAHGTALYNLYRGAFPPGYRDAFEAYTAVGDIDRIEQLRGGAAFAMNLYRRIDADTGSLNFKLYSLGAPVPLSDVLPMLEHMGLRVIGEAPYEVTMKHGEGDVWIHDYDVRTPGSADVDLVDLKETFHEAFGRVWAGDLEDDGFNSLVLSAGLDWRAVTILRGYYKYLRQARINFSQRYIESTVTNHPRIAGMLVDLFMTKFDPKNRKNAESRAAKLKVKIEQALDTVSNLDEDRILRRCLNLIVCTLRTNFFQSAEGGGPKPYVSFKLDSQNIDGLELPKPMVEIFVYSPRVEAVHLRFGKVARGGLRWSDRLEDFRSEVLGLVKAQQVKNAVIVPVGSKGGFVVKRPPAERDALMAEVIECYKTKIRGLLDITDNLKGNKIVPPKDVIRLDGDDPYLVVAADKGTATFSDIANGVSLDYGFWLGDAFASGGSAGYDHKKMAITARGAWESVKRHFREIGVDTQTEDFTTVGCGDMSGDVFGNGMLLSKHIKLVGAFNHMHIFVDPSPDPAKSWDERKRMFDLPRSAWTDYDAKLISKGGGIFDRKAKSIKLSPEVRKLFDIPRESVTPNELIVAMLTAEVDLLWFGGIGTYIKASSESHADASDRANDALRINGKDLRCKVIAEGANLGATQLGRIEFGQSGGRLNTDAIDNSAGVDCSDHEVNIKILLGAVVANGDMTYKQRDKLLVQMTDEVADLVLWDNYRQSGTITVTQSMGGKLLDQQSRYMRALERAGRLNRAVEFLPDDEELADRRQAGESLTRPELAVLLAYSKLELYEELLPSDMLDDPLLVDDLKRYFPKPLREKFSRQIEKHRLRREIIATYITNSTVNRVGGTFMFQMKRKTGMAAPEIARAYTATRDVFDLRDIWAATDGLDNKVPAAVQTELILVVSQLVERCTLWFLHNCPPPIDIKATVNEFRPGVATLAGCLDDILSDADRDALAARAKYFSDQGVPKKLAQKVARVEILGSTLDVVRLAAASKVKEEYAGRIYFDLGHRFGLDWLRSSADQLEPETEWQKMAIDAIIDDLYGHQGEFTASVLASGNGKTSAKTAMDGAIDSWAEDRHHAIDRVQTVINDLRTSGTVDLAMLTVANRQLRAMNLG